MPKAPRRCPAAGCTNLIRHTRYCPEHTESWSTPSGWQRPTNWASLRRAVLARDHGICHVCGQPGADTVDHVTPQSQGGSDDPTNLAPVHDRTPPHCHRAKTNRDRGRTTPTRPSATPARASGGSVTFHPRTHSPESAVRALRRPM